MARRTEDNPNWYLDPPPRRSYRSIFKWGDPSFNKVPKASLVSMMRSRFNIEKPLVDPTEPLGLETVPSYMPSKLTEAQVSRLKAIVGDENVSLDGYDRLSVAYGKTMSDLMRLRAKIVENVADAVVYPSTTEDIEKLVAFCYEENVPLYVYGGGSSVTRGVEPVAGGLSLDMRRHFNKVIAFNEIDHTITVQAGMSGPDLERHLQNAVKEFGAKAAYTVGHFPQSFEYSSVGGWVVTRGAGQNSTYYGKIEDLVLGQDYVTPIGHITSDSYARKATGPSIDQIMMGSEGAFGVLCTVTLKFSFWRPENHLRFSYIFPSWEKAREAARTIMQAESGNPSVFRLSDPEETEVMLGLYGVDESPLEGLLRLRGFKSGERCLFLGFTDGQLGFCRNLKRSIHRICKSYGAMYLTALPAKGWEKGRFLDPYMRDSMEDFGVVTDTLECTVNWSNMAFVHKSVREYCHSRPNTICMTHMSHAYAQGANLYWIFITQCSDLEDFKAYHRGILDAIQASGAAISHHHGIGKLFAPWLEGCIGTRQMEVFKALKAHFDPKNLMNPGGTVGLDLQESEKRFIRPRW